MSNGIFAKKAVSKVGLIVVVVVIIVIVVGAGLFALLPRSSTQTTTSSVVSTSSISSSTSSTATSTSSSVSSPLTSSTTSSSTSVSTPATTSSSVTSSSSSTETTTSATVVPSSLTYDTLNTIFSLDPTNNAEEYANGIIQNVYDKLLWYNGSSSTTLIPWLASNYTISSDGKTANFTLRSGISFADGEPLNSTSVYFSLVRDLIADGSLPGSHGVGNGYTVQQLANQSLATYYSVPQSYNSSWVSSVLAENFVQITGPMTFTINIQNPYSAWNYILASEGADIVAPIYVMQHDLSLWNQTSNGYTLPFPTLSGNETNQFDEYFRDMAATCNTGATPSGCGTTYLYGSTDGSLAGTGPYIIANASLTTNDLTLVSNPSYWGGPYQFMGGQKVVPQIKTIQINYIESEPTRLLNLQNGARSGQALMIDLTADQLYSVVDRNAWLDNGTLTSIIPGVSVYPPAPYFATYFGEFYSNVTNPLTGLKETFQPNADIRFREAIADSVNMTEVDQDVDNNLGQVANEAIPPGIPPAGAFNVSIPAGWSYNPDKVQQLLLSMMENPITTFTETNGTAAPPGLYNNTFGCTSSELSANGGTCKNPVQQSVTLIYTAGDLVSESVETGIATTINNVSSTYNMGLTISVEPLPESEWIVDAIDGTTYFYIGFNEAAYPWADSITEGVQFLSGLGNWNLTTLNAYYSEMASENAGNNITGYLSTNLAFNNYLNQEVLFLWTFFPDQPYAGSAIAVFTSNVQGYYYNPSLNGVYFAALS